MSALCLPPETLQEIFKYLDGGDLLNCRTVSIPWKEAVDGISDAQWHKICEKEYMYSVYKKIHETSTIPWRDTFIALNSWANIKSAKMESRQLPELRIQRFKILPNRMLAILTNSKQDSKDLGSGFSDTIVYYDIDTLQELERKTYENPFYDYDENEHLIVLLFKNNELSVVQKASNKQEVVGKVYAIEDFFRMHMQQFGLLGKKVYFQNENYQICLSILKTTKTGESVIKTARLKVYEDDDDIHDEYLKHIRAFGCRDNHLTILTYEGYVYEYVDKEFCILSKLKWYSSNIIIELNEYGIDWTSPMVYLWLLGRFENIETSKIPHVSIRLHGPVISIGTLKKRLIHLFYKKEGGLFSYKARPTRTVNMNSLAEMSADNDSVCQIDIVESADHHLVIAQTDQRVFVLKFGFEATEEIGSEDGEEIGFEYSEDSEETGSEDSEEFGFDDSEEGFNDSEETESEDSEDPGSEDVEETGSEDNEETGSEDENESITTPAKRKGLQPQSEAKKVAMNPTAESQK